MRYELSACDCYGALVVQSCAQPCRDTFTAATSTILIIRVIRYAYFVTSKKTRRLNALQSTRTSMKSLALPHALTTLALLHLYSTPPPAFVPLFGGCLNFRD